MTPEERSARFRAVVARAMAKPLSELPYRAPVTSRFRVADVRPEADAAFMRGTNTAFLVTEAGMRPASRKKRANPAALPGPTRMDSR